MRVCKCACAGEVAELREQLNDANRENVKDAVKRGMPFFSTLLLFPLAHQFLHTPPREFPRMVYGNAVERCLWESIWSCAWSIALQ